MTRVIRWGLGAVVLVAMSAAAGCGSSSSNDTTPTPDVPQDVTPDVPADVPPTDTADVPPPDDVPPTDTVPDVVADTPPADAMADIPWETLPRLPQGKTFTKKFAAGVGRGDLSPVKPSYLGGFGFCMGDDTLCRKTDGVHDPLLASAVAIADPATGEVVIFVGIDTIGLIRQDVEDIHYAVQMKLYEDFGVHFPGARAILSASHAHSTCDTIGLWGPMFGAGRDEEYTKIVEDAIVKAARDAYADLQDTTLDWGKGSYKNSDEDAYADDQELYVLRGKKADDSTLFTMVRWPGHPTTYGERMHAASADYVGTMRKKIEDTLGGMNVFMQGPIGSVYPDRPNECGLTEEAFPEGDRTTTDMNPNDYMKTTCTGYAIAQVALDALQATTPVAETGIEFKHASFSFHPDNEVLMMLAEVGPLPYDWVDVNDPESRMRSIYSLARIGDLTYLTNPGESFPVFSEMSKTVAKEAGFTTPITIGLGQDWMGYLLNEEQWKNVDLSYHQSLSPGKLCYSAYETSLRETLGLPAAATP